MRRAAAPNPRDSLNLTPLDLAVCEGGDGAGSSPVIAELRSLGLMTADEVLAEVKAENLLSADGTKGQ